MDGTSYARSLAGLTEAIVPSRFVIISGYHDYRTKRRANLHFIADQLVRFGSVFFLSLRFSSLTRLTEDPRHELGGRANRVETVGGIDCFLWKTLVHACRLPDWAAIPEAVIFELVSSYLPQAGVTAVGAADLIFIESGIAIIYLPLLRRLNPNAKIIYFAADALDAIGQAKAIKRALRRHASLLDRAILPSPLLRDELPACVPCHVIPHGIEKLQFAAIGASPYRRGTLNAVSVGSMLFDPHFVQLAAACRPDVTFHLIGSGHSGPGASNVVYHPEMPFAATLPFIRHADIAIAAYGDGVAPYLRDTSMKLMQYGFLGIPAICPTIVAADVPGRFGYERADAGSIEAALRAALSSRAVLPQAQLGWDDVALRWINPDRFADTEFISDKQPRNDAESHVHRKGDRLSLCSTNKGESR